MSTLINNYKVLFIEVKAMNVLFKQIVAISRHLPRKNKSHRSNFISSLVVIYNRKVKDFYIYYNSNKDFELRNVYKLLIKFKSFYTEVYKLIFL